MLNEHKVFVLWGSDEVILDNPDEAPAEYKFNTQEELDAFVLGVQEAMKSLEKDAYNFFDSEQEADEFVTNLLAEHGEAEEEVQ